MIEFNFMNRAMRRAIMVANLATALAGSTAGIAWAQAASAPARDAVQTNAITTAPADERQPRRAPLPLSIQHEQNSELSSERAFDQQLRICAGC